MERLNEKYCAPDGTISNICNQLESTTLKKPIKNALLGIYLFDSISMRYVVPIIMSIFFMEGYFFTFLNFFVFMGSPYVTIVGYYPLYTESGNLALLILNIVIAVIAYVIAFVAVGFESIPPLLFNILFSTVLLIDFNEIVSIIALVALIITSIVPWELLVLWRRSKKEEQNDDIREMVQGKIE